MEIPGKGVALGELHMWVCICDLLCHCLTSVTRLAGLLSSLAVLTKWQRSVPYMKTVMHSVIVIHCSG